MRSIIGPELGARLKPIWGLDPEGEIKGAWRDIGVPRAWCMMGETSLPFQFRGEHRFLTHPAGNFALCRFHSTHIALRGYLFAHTGGVCGSADIASHFFAEIKAIEEGLFDEKRYSLETTLE